MPVKKPRATRYPPIPASLDLPGGPVPVTVIPRKAMEQYADPGEELWGYFHEGERRISLLGTLSKEAQWRVLYHEWTHALLQDSGLANGLGHELEEALCDAMASGLMRLLRSPK